MPARAPIVDEDEIKWINELTKFPAAKPLIQHFSAFESIVKSGGQKGVEPPIDQASTWRRMFCWELQRSDNPFGIASPTGKLPKCIAICNLSGHHSFYYSDSYNLGKILCIAAQRIQTHVINGVIEVFNKAEEIGASVLVCFCLPFQVGLERCYWEARTIRKTSKGVVKDGEMCFTISDQQARVVSCTLASEHWPDEMFIELVKKMMNVVSPVCLDFTEETEKGMTMDKLEVAVKILKTDRKKMMDDHKREIQEIEETAQAELEEQKTLVLRADEEANKRVAQVISARNANEATLNKEIATLKEEKADLLSKNATLHERMRELMPRLAGMKLEHDTELSKASARQKALQAQVSQMQSSHAKQVAEHSKQQQALKKSHDDAIEARNAKIQELKRQLIVANNTAAAVNAGAKEAHEMSKKLEIQLKQMSFASRVCLSVVTESGRRRAKRIETLHQSDENEKSTMKEKIAAMQKEIDSKDAEIKKLSAVVETASKETETDASICAEPIPEEKPSKEELDLKRDAQQKEHLISEMRKKTAFLESKLKESDAEVKKLKEASAIAQQPPGKKKAQKGGDDSHTNGVQHSGGHQQQLNISQNTAVFMGQPPHTLPHQQAFPQGQFIVDPALEGMVSQVHSALNCITAMARASSTHKRAAEVAHGKLEAISSQGYYDPAYSIPQQPYYTNGY
jgi:hypothetical protein